MRLAVAVLVALLLLPAVPRALASSMASNKARAPAYAQFVARLFVEGLGRLPTAAEWASAIDDFETHCSVGKMRWYAATVFTSAEFAERPYDTRARLLALYRAYYAADLSLEGADYWSREVEAQGWNAVALRLGGWIVDACDTVDPGVGFQPRAASRLREDNYDAAGMLEHPECPGDPASSCVLNRLLQEAKAGSRIVRLPPMAVIDVTDPIVVPEGVTLTTEGDPTPRDYAGMARLVRRWPFTPHATVREIALVIVEQGATLRSVWVDGQRGVGGAPPDVSMNVLVMGGVGATLRDTVQSNSNGGTTVFVAGQSQGAPSPYAGVPCRDATIAGNRITAYASAYFGGPDRAAGLTDGITLFCEGALVAGNDIVDTSDAGIAVFASLGPIVPLPQASVVRDNRILSAGNPMFYGIALDTQGIRPGCAPDDRRRDYDGLLVTGNTLFSGPHTHFDTGISVGARILWGLNYPGKASGLRMARVTGNRVGLTASEKGKVPHTRVGIPIAIAGAYQATVRSNATLAGLKPRLFRPRAQCAKLNAPFARRPPIVASVRAGWASGTFDRFADQDISGCICQKSSPNGSLAAIACVPEAPGIFERDDDADACS